MRVKTPMSIFDWASDLWAESLLLSLRLVWKRFLESIFASNSTSVTVSLPFHSTSSYAHVLNTRLHNRPHHKRALSSNEIQWTSRLFAALWQCKVVHVLLMPRLLVKWCDYATKLQFCWLEDIKTDYFYFLPITTFNMFTNFNPPSITKNNKPSIMTKYKKYTAWKDHIRTIYMLKKLFLTYSENDACLKWYKKTTENLQLIS